MVMKGNNDNVNILFKLFLLSESLFRPTAWPTQPYTAQPDEERKQKKKKKKDEKVRKNNAIHPYVQTYVHIRHLHLTSSFVLSCHYTHE